MSGVGTLSAAVSTTVLNLATADEDLEDFGDTQFASDLRLDHSWENGLHFRRLDRKFRNFKGEQRNVTITTFLLFIILL